MKKSLVLFGIMLFTATMSFAQVAINKDGSAPDASSILHVKGQDAGGNAVEALYVKSANGNVGIGTTNPGANLTIHSEVPHLSITPTNSNGQSVLQLFTLDNDGDGIIDSGDKGWHITGRGDNYGIPDQRNDLIFWHYGNGWSSSLLTIDGVTGNIGIGTTTPDNKINVVGGTDVTPSGGGYLTLGAESGVNLSVDNNEIMARNNGATSVLYIQREGGNTLLNQLGGNVGIGTLTPDAKLEVTGQIKITGGSPGDGKVLTSDANGMANWQALPAGASNGGVSLGGSMATAFMVSQNMFAPHTDNCASTEAFVPLYGGATVGFCIEKNERTIRFWSVAVQNCLAVGKRLPEPFEWQTACDQAGTLGLNDMKNNWEWASNFPLPMYDGSKFGIGVTVFGNGGCGSGLYTWLAYTTQNRSSQAFRCVH